MFRSPSIKAMNHMTMHEDALNSTVPSTRETLNRIRIAPLALIGAYSAIFIATLLDALHGQNLIATSSLLMVGLVALVLLHVSRAFTRLKTIDDWLWQLARCSALAGLAGALVGLCIMAFGNASFETMTLGLSFAAFSVLYGVLVAMPAGCAVVLGPEG